MWRLTAGDVYLVHVTEVSPRTAICQWGIAAQSALSGGNRPIIRRPWNTRPLPWLPPPPPGLCPNLVSPNLASLHFLFFVLSGPVHLSVASPLLSTLMRGYHPMLFRLYENNILTPSRHVELAQYADGTALVATAGSSSLLVGYLQAYLVRWSAGYRTGGLPSTSRRALLCSLFRPRDTYKNPEQCTFSDSQYSGSKKHGILGWPLILCSPSRRKSARW
jgi:hypothetical protein